MQLMYRGDFPSGTRNSTMSETQFRRDPQARDGSTSRLSSANAKKSLLPEHEGEVRNETQQWLAKAIITNPRSKNTPRLVHEFEYVNSKVCEPRYS
jgi:hypothetical protein